MFGYGIYRKVPQPKIPPINQNPTLYFASGQKITIVDAVRAILNHLELEPGLRKERNKK